MKLQQQRRQLAGKEHRKQYHRRCWNFGRTPTAAATKIQRREKLQHNTRNSKHKRDGRTMKKQKTKATPIYHCRKTERKRGLMRKKKKKFASHSSKMSARRHFRRDPSRSSGGNESGMREKMWNEGFGFPQFWWINSKSWEGVLAITFLKIWWSFGVLTTQNIAQFGNTLQSHEEKEKFLLFFYFIFFRNIT